MKLLVVEKRLIVEKWKCSHDFWAEVCNYLTVAWWWMARKGNTDHLCIFELNLHILCNMIVLTNIAVFLRLLF